MIYEELRKKYPHVKIVAVTKNHPWPDCEFLYNAGARDFGENKVQEALEKLSQAPQDAHFHFIGTLQKNKVNKVGRNFTLIHSVDSIELAQKIAAYSPTPQPILLQVNIHHKHGFTPDSLHQVYEMLKQLPSLEIQGLMTMAPDTDDTTLIRSTFKTLRTLGDSLQLKELSMGMSNDYEIAIDEGATIIRLGTLLFKK
jgi:pyridoxal phosphate enzyme (YggS family)